MNKIYLLIPFILLMGCIQESSDPTDISQLKADPMNPITASKIVMGNHFFGNPSISLDGRTACTNCHDANKGMKTPSAQFPSGCGVGCILTDVGLFKDVNFKSVMDIMPINSYGGIGAGHQQSLGMSNRFGMTAKSEEDKAITLAHFKLKSMPECDGLLFQAFVALGGHKLLLKERVLQDTTGVKLLRLSGFEVNEDTDPDSLAFFIACGLDVFQRSFYPYGIKRDLTLSQTLGREVFLKNCQGCHENEFMGGGLQPSMTPNLSIDAPDCYQDVFGEKERYKYPMRNVKPLKTNLRDHEFYGVDGRVDSIGTSVYSDLDRYMLDHYEFYLKIGIIEDSLRQIDLDRTVDYIKNGLYSKELPDSWSKFVPDSLMHY